MKENELVEKKLRNLLAVFYAESSSEPILPSSQIYSNQKYIINNIFSIKKNWNSA